MLFKTMVYSDAPSTTNKNGIFWVGYVIFKANGKNKAKSLNYGRNKYRTFVKSALCTVSFEFANDRDSAIFIQHDLKQELNISLQI